MRLKRSHQEGFTLIEIMIAVVILAIISLLLWQSTYVLMHAKERYELEDERFHEVILALSRMADDLSMAFLYQSKDHTGSSGTGEAQRVIRFYGKENGDQDELHFASFSNLRFIRGSRENEQAEISYMLKKREGEEESGWDLIKRTQSPPDREPEAGGNEYVVLENVKEFKLQYYDEGRKEWRREWDSASVDFNKRIPKAVEIAIVIEDPLVPEETKTFTTTALLEMSPGPNDF